MQQLTHNILQKKKKKKKNLLLKSASIFAEIYGKGCEKIDKRHFMTFLRDGIYYYKGLGIIKIKVSNCFYVVVLLVALFLFLY